MSSHCAACDAPPPTAAECHVLVSFRPAQLVRVDRLVSSMAGLDIDGRLY